LRLPSGTGDSAVADLDAMQQRGDSVQILVAVAASKDCPDTKTLSDDPHVHTVPVPRLNEADGLKRGTARDED